MLKKIVSLFLLLFTFSYGETLIVAAAANTQFAIKEIIKSFEEKYPEVNIKTVISSSGKLTSQIIKGAPYDIFISADSKYPDFLYKKGFTYGKPKVYAYGVLVLWSVKHPDIKGVKDLLKSYIKKIALPNPRNAPYGKQALNVLMYYKIYKKIKNRIVYGESVSQASQYIYKGFVDAGFTAKSIVMAPEVKNKGKWIEIDKKAYEPIKQEAVLLKNSKGKKYPEIFFNYLFSKEVKRILNKYGYITK